MSLGRYPFGEKKTRSVQKQFSHIILLRPRATWNEVGLYLRWKGGMFTQNECVAETLVAVCAGLFAVVALLLGGSTVHYLNKINSVSSSSISLSSLAP